MCCQVLLLSPLDPQAPTQCTLCGSDSAQTAALPSETMPPLSTGTMWLSIIGIPRSRMLGVCWRGAGAPGSWLFKGASCQPWASTSPPPLPVRWPSCPLLPSRSRGTWKCLQEGKGKHAQNPMFPLQTGRPVVMVLVRKHKYLTDCFITRGGVTGIWH